MKQSLTKKINGLIGLVILFFSLNAMAQSQVNGTVKDDSGMPLPGATVKVKNSNVASATKIDGSFSITATKSQTLEISSVGYDTQEVPVGKGNLAITLKTSSKGLNEVVVVGYGSSRKKDLTGAITTIKAEDVGGRRAVQVSDALQGAIAGVTVTRNGGAPGASSNIRFRGITTLGVNDPLVIVDGVPSGNIDYLNPDDIESVTALKDAASTAIYGSRAAAGVLLITTKRAKSGQTSLDYSYEYGNIRPINQPPTTDVIRYMQLFNEYKVNDGAAPLYTQAYIDSYLANNAANPNLYPNTDWQAAIIGKSAPRQMHNISLSSGSENIKTRASLGYSTTDALYANRGFKKYTANVNNDFKFNDKITASFDIGLVRTENTDINNFNNNIFLDARILPPIYGDYYTDGRYSTGKDGRNPVAQIYEGGFNNSTTNNIKGRIALNYKPFNGLTLTAQAAPTYIFIPKKQFIKQIEFTDPADASKVIARSSPVTQLREDRNYYSRFNGLLLANYNKTFNSNHNLDVTLGYEENTSYDESITASRGSYTLTNYPYLSDGLLGLSSNDGGASATALRSGFGRLSYNFKSKYYLQASGRYDESSRFNPNKRSAFYPSAAAGWAISEEPFFKQIKSIDFLKFRGSWGQSGNERLTDGGNSNAPDPNYPYQANIDLYNALFYQGGLVTALASGSQTKYAVYDITWETQETANVGLDAAFLKNRLTVSADFFHKQTKNILLDLNIPLYLGYIRPFQNAGKVSAKGFEVTVNWSDKIGTDWKYGFGLNLSDAKTNVDDLKGTSRLGDQANIEGNEYNAWYGYRSAGLFQSAAEIATSPVLSSGTKPGDVKYVDIDGDGKITSDKDKVILGGSLPRYTFGINGRLAYNNFDFSFVANGVGKQLVRLSNYAVQPFQESFGNVPALIDGKFWSTNNTPEQNLAAKYPRLSNTSGGNNYASSDLFLINGQYLRIKNITLGYTVQKSITQKIGIQGIRLYLACNDAFTFSHFPKGSDPEVDAIAYPIVRTFIAGLNVKF